MTVESSEVGSPPPGPDDLEKVAGPADQGSARRPISPAADPAETGGGLSWTTILAATLLLAGGALGLGFAAGRAGRVTGPAPEFRAATIVAERPTAVVDSLAAGADVAQSPVNVDPAPGSDTGGIAFGVVEEGVASIGEPAPPFSLPGVDGVPIVLGDYLGSPVLLNFFATWCTPCRVEMPHLQAAYEDHADEGLVVLAVDLQESPELVAGYLAEMGLTFPAALDADSRVSLEKYRVATLPTSVLIDREGDVALISQRYYMTREALEADLRFILVE